MLVFDLLLVRMETDGCASDKMHSADSFDYMVFTCFLIEFNSIVLLMILELWILDHIICMELLLFCVNLCCSMVII